MLKNPLSPVSALPEPMRVALVTVALLAPFLTKAFHVDDTLFLRAAEQILRNPLDFYGLSINWYGFEMPMTEVNQNPPLVPYLIAAASALFGSSELALHGVFLLSAVAATLGSWRLAGSFCAQPAIAALALAVSPVFLVSSTSLMTDTTMLALLVWGLALWVRGLESDRWQPCLVAALLIAASALSKFFGIVAVPLLVLLTLTRTRRLDARLLLLGIPLLALLCFDLWYQALYGRSLLSSALGYAQANQQKTLAGQWQKLVTGLSFTGGCLAPFVFFSPLLYSHRRLLLGGSIGLGIIATLLIATGSIGSFELVREGSLRVPRLLQLSLFILAGSAVLLQGVRDLMRRRDGDSLFLCCWVLGTFVFTSFINWTISARNILPLAPAVAILIARQLQSREPTLGAPASTRATAWPLVPAALLALAVAWADASLANGQRSSARTIMSTHASERTVWFQGHWGFQYYMEQAGARPVDLASPRMKSGDLLIVPTLNTNTVLPSPSISPIKVYRANLVGWLGVIGDAALGAGFYSDRWGPQPYAFGAVPPADFLVYSVDVGESR